MIAPNDEAAEVGVELENAGEWVQVVFCFDEKAVRLSGAHVC